MDDDRQVCNMVGVPTVEPALDEPFRAFPAWFLRIECDRWGLRVPRQVAHDRALRDILTRMRCAGLVGMAETAEGNCSRVQPATVRRILLPDG